MAVIISGLKQGKLFKKRPKHTPAQIFGEYFPRGRLNRERRVINIYLCLKGKWLIRRKVVFLIFVLVVNRTANVELGLNYKFPKV